MRKAFEEPMLKVVRFEMADTVTTDPAEGFSTNFDYGEGIDEW